MRKLGPHAATGPELPFSMPKHKPRSRATLNLDKEHGGAMPNVRVGDSHSMTLDGTVTGLNSDEYGHRVEMDVSPKGITHNGPKSLTQAMKQRKRHMASGRWTA